MPGEHGVCQYYDSLSLTSNIQRNIAIVNYQRYETDEYFLFVFDIPTWKIIAKIQVPGKVDQYDFSDDGMQMLTSGANHKDLVLYDLSEVHDGTIVPIASLNFPVECNFCHLSRDGEIIIASIKDMKGLTFFTKCGHVIKNQKVAPTKKLTITLE